MFILYLGKILKILGWLKEIVFLKVVVYFLYERNLIQITFKENGVKIGWDGNNYDDYYYVLSFYYKRCFRYFIFIRIYNFQYNFMLVLFYRWTC